MPERHLANGYINNYVICPLTVSPTQTEFFSSLEILEYSFMEICGLLARHTY